MKCSYKDNSLYATIKRSSRNNRLFLKLINNVSIGKGGVFNNLIIIFLVTQSGEKRLKND
jgi:hypothetical protein